MNQATTLTFKNTGSTTKPKVSRKFFVGLLLTGLAIAAFFYWQNANQPQVASAPTKTRPTAPVATVPAAGKPELAASAPKSDAPPATAIIEAHDSTTVVSASIADTSAKVFPSSVNAAFSQTENRTAQPWATGTTKSAKRMAIPSATQASADDDGPPLTAEQKRSKLAQEGFGEAMNQANKNPDIYGFLPSEDLGAAMLGEPIPVYTLDQPGRASYSGQPLKSLLQPAEEWVYPIVLNNRIRFMVKVRSFGNEYVLGQGSRALAMVYEKILARWPASEGYHPQLVTLHNLPGYHFTIPELPGQNLTDTSRMFDFNPALSPATVMLASWR